MKAGLSAGVMADSRAWQTADLWAAMRVGKMAVARAVRRAALWVSKTVVMWAAHLGE